MVRAHYVVAYDVISDRRRNKIHKALLDFGRWVQFSVFECELNPRDFVRMKARVEDLINRDEDSVVIYRLCQSCLKDVENMGIKKAFDKREYIV